jgi:hypothetical protein
VKFNIPKVELSLFNKKIQDEIKALPETFEVQFPPPPPSLGNPLFLRGFYFF